MAKIVIIKEKCSIAFDGLHVKKFEKGETIELPESHADQIILAGLAEYENKTPAQKRETKEDAPEVEAEEVEEEPVKKKSGGKKSGK